MFLPPLDWQVLHETFMALAAEETKLTQGKKSLTVLGMYEGHGEYGRWSIIEDVTENLKERFNMVAAQAGKALGPPVSESARNFWLHCLYQHLREGKSVHLKVADDSGGAVERVIEASATFCAVLKTREVEREGRN